MGERLACLINIGFAGQPDEARGCCQAIVLSPETLLASNHNTQPSVSVLLARTTVLFISPLLKLVGSQSSNSQ
jgi:hypothetical protein